VEKNLVVLVRQRGFFFPSLVAPTHRQGKRDGKKKGRLEAFCTFFIIIFYLMPLSNVANSQNWS